MRRLSLALLFVLAGVAAGVVHLGADALRSSEADAQEPAAAPAARERPPAAAVPARP